MVVFFIVFKARFKPFKSKFTLVIIKKNKKRINMTKKIIKQNDYFQSSDLPLCATLCCFNYQIEDIDTQNPQKVIFIIRKDKQINDLIQQFWTHRLKVEPMSFFNSLKTLKARIYSRE